MTMSNPSILNLKVEELIEYKDYCLISIRFLFVSIASVRNNRCFFHARSNPGFFMPIFKEVRVVANRIKGITVEIGGDTTGLDKALNSVNSSITKTQSALNDVNRLLKLDPSNTILVAQKQELLAQAVSQTEEKLSALEAAQEQVAAAFARGDIGADKYQAFQREIEETRGKLNKYKVDLSDLQTEQDALSQNTARLEKLFAAKGIFRKVLIFLLVGIANIIDVQVIGTGAVLRTAVIFFYISNEGVSLLENAGHLGLPIPEKIKTVLEQLHDRAEKEEEK